MYQILTIATVVASAVMAFVAILTLGGILNMAEECDWCNKKSRFHTLKTVFLTLFILIDGAFYVSVGVQSWRLSLLFGVLTLIILSCATWLWSKHHVDAASRGLLFFVHLVLLGSVLLCTTLDNTLNDYKWEHKKIYVVHSVENNAQVKQADTLYIFNNRVISKPD